GWGACDTKKPNKELGWAGPDSGPTWLPDPDKPDWSLRSKRFIDGMKENLDFNKSNIELLIVDKHMNEPEFADLMSGILADMLNGKWEKGSRNNLSYVQSV
ncbi:MAG TPA: hypothetical protein DD429_07555, partial [Clostridiaceae bacterium]|nr:hypothetical protein [Clostridiaceae bacterium]